MPLSWVLQLVFSLTVVMAAVICLRLGSPRHRHRQESDTLWLLTGAAFLLHGITATLQNVFGGIALARGFESPTMATYVQWDPVMNHSRTFLMFGLMALLLVAAFRRRPVGRWFWVLAAAVLLAGLGVGAAVGVREGAFTEANHYSAVAVWDEAELLVVFATLLALLLSNAADRFLWGFLGAYSASLALSVFWFLLFTKLKVPGTWHPPIWTLHAMRLAWAVIMAAFAGRALQRRRRGQPLPGMLGPRTQMVSALR
ncbi:MAG TPA: hypothetical protein VFJ16_18900 [Longimicrobium sp.]|nr:hypothetical protein [Longimicrobium sp.]